VPLPWTHTTLKALCAGDRGTSLPTARATTAADISAGVPCEPPLQLEVADVEGLVFQQPADVGDTNGYC